MLDIGLSAHVVLCLCEVELEYRLLLEHRVLLVLLVLLALGWIVGVGVGVGVGERDVGMLVQATNHKRGRLLCRGEKASVSEAVRSERE